MICLKGTMTHFCMYSKTQFLILIDVFFRLNSIFVLKLFIKCVKYILIFRLFIIIKYIQYLWLLNKSDQNKKKQFKSGLWIRQILTGGSGWPLSTYTMENRKHFLRFDGSKSLFKTQVDNIVSQQLKKGFYLLIWFQQIIARITKLFILRFSKTLDLIKSRV